MKIKLANQQSRKRIQQLNSRLKLLASDIHGEDKYKASNLSQVGSNQLLSNASRLSKRNYFNSAVNLNTCQGPDNNGLYMGNKNDNRQDNLAIGPSSPKFSTASNYKQASFAKYHKPYQQPASPKLQYSSSGSNLASSKKEMLAKKQFKQIIETKKEFHSLIKRELSQLQRLEEMLIEQPEKWDEEEERFYHDERWRRGILSNHHKNSLKANNYDTSKQQKSAIEQAQYSMNQQLSKKKTQESIQQQISHYNPTAQQLSNHTNNITLHAINNPPLQSPFHSVQSSQQSQYFHQQSQTQNRNNKTSTFNKEDKLQSQIKFDRRQAQLLLRQMMIVDYSEDNIRSILQLVQDQSQRRSKRNSKQNSANNSLSQSNFNTQNPSIISQSSANTHLSNRKSQLILNGNKSDHVKQNDCQRQYLEEEKHYQLIHSYKLLSLVRKIKQFTKLKRKLSQNLSSRKKLDLADNHHTTKLMSKSFACLTSHFQKCLQQQTMLFKIKTIYTHNMLKKSSIKQLLFNAKYKTFKFLSAKLMYQQELKVKSLALKRMLEHRNKSDKYDQVSRLTQEINKKSLFKLVKQKYLEGRETNAKYRLLKNLVKHRAWNGFVKVVRFDWVKNVIRAKGQEQKEKEKGTINTRSFINSPLTQFSSRQDNTQSLCPSSSIEQMLISNLNSYTELFTSHMSQLKKPSYPQQLQQSSINLANISQSQTIMEFSEPIVLHIKKSILQKYLVNNARKRVIEKFVMFVSRERDRNQKRFQIEEKQNQIIKKVILRCKKTQLIQNMKHNSQNYHINQKLSYFCNMTIGKIPLSINHNQTLNQPSQSTNQQTNPLMIKYYKNLFMTKIKQFLSRQNKIKLQNQVYYETIYGTNLLRKTIKQWKNAIQIMKDQQTQQQNLRKQSVKDQEKFQKQLIEHQQRQNRLKKHQQQLQHQQTLIKQHQHQLKLTQSHLNHQQTQLKLKSQSIQSKLSHLQKQQLHLSNLQKAKIQQLKDQAQKIQKDKQRLIQQAERQKQQLLEEEKQMMDRLEKLREEEKIRQGKLRHMDKIIQEKNQQQTNSINMQNYSAQSQQQNCSAESQQQSYSAQSQEQNQLQQRTQLEQNQAKLQSHWLKNSQTQHYLVQQSMLSNQNPRDDSFLLNQQSHNQTYQSASNRSVTDQRDSRIQQQQFSRSKESEEEQKSDIQQEDQSNHSFNHNQNQNNENYHQNDSQQSEQILAGYLTQNRTQPSQNISPNQQSSPNFQYLAQPSTNNQQDSSLKMDDMMDWLGNKIGIKSMNNYKIQESHYSCGKYQDSRNQVQSQNQQQPQEEYQTEENDELFANMLKPQPHKQPIKLNKSLNKSQIHLSKQSYNLNHSNISKTHQQSVKNSKKSISQPQLQDSDLLNHSKQQQPQSEPPYQEAPQQPQQYQSQPQSHSDQDLASSTSQSHIRLLTYAQNHYNKHILHLIFHKIFKQKLYQQQQIHDRNLLTTVFTHWKSFYTQKKSLKKYLDIYQQIQTRINADNYDGRKSRRQGRSLEKATNNLTANRYMSGGKTNKKQRTVQVITAHQNNKDKTNTSQQSGLKYFPTSKKQKGQFEKLYK